MHNLQRKPATEWRKTMPESTGNGIKPNPSVIPYVIDCSGMVTTVENASQPAFNPATCGRDASA